MSSNHYKFVIVGGGVAGLTAAMTLREKGQDNFVVLEASQRLGGRVCSNAERGIELGGEFVHGENSLLWDVLVNKLKVPLKFSFDYSKSTPEDCRLSQLIGMCCSLKTLTII